MENRTLKTLSAATLGRNAGRVMVVAISVRFALLLILVGVLLALSPGRTQTLADES